MKNIGFMQGRLSDVVDGVIQEFPWKSWEDEFHIASEIDIHIMEWTLDQEDLYLNPLLTNEGHEKISHLCELYSFKIPSLTGDCFMQFPFWKAEGPEKTSLVSDFVAIVNACGKLGIGIIVIPLVDNGSLENSKQESMLINTLNEYDALLKKLNVKIAFESDFAPQKLAEFINLLDSESFGINYDIGNSAALGFIPDEEFSHYGDRIINVHVKDRPLGRTTVPLGEGDSDFESVFKNLSKHNYKGNYILQTARDRAGRHSHVLKRYLKQTTNWIQRYGS